MPELPEVESVVRGLNKVLAEGETPEVVRRALAFRKDLRFVIPPKLLKMLPGSACLSVQRRAKYILFNFLGPKHWELVNSVLLHSEGESNVHSGIGSAANASAMATFQMISHLGMTGAWRIEKQKGWEKRLHDHFALEFVSNRTLVYNDPRRFGYLELAERPAQWAVNAKTEVHSGSESPSTSGLEAPSFLDMKVFPHPLLDNLGPEPLSEEFSGEYLFSRSRKRQVAIKVFIMNQKIVVGVGNIYASEALFRARIHPAKLAKHLSLQEAQRLVASIRHILGLAIREGGSSIRDYKNVEGGSGGFQNLFQVYGRAGEPCVVCHTKIKQVVLGGRSTFWCPRCQARVAGRILKS